MTAICKKNATESWALVIDPFYDPVAPAAEPGYDHATFNARSEPWP